MIEASQKLQGETTPLPKLLWPIAAILIPVWEDVKDPELDLSMGILDLSRAILDSEDPCSHAEAAVEGS